MRRHTFTRSTLLLMSTLAIAACGGDDDDPFDPGDGDDLGSLTATVTGHVSESFTGEALYAQDTDGAWGLYMGGDAENESGIWFWGEGGRPGTGAHTLTLDGGTGGWYVNGAAGSFYWAETGTLTITTSSASRVAGSFDFTGTDMAGGEVTVEGTFSAPNASDL